MSQINAVELKERIAAGESLILVDVRELIEFHTFNIGGVNIPLGKLAESLNTWHYNKTDEIIVICKVGMRSKTAQTLLEQNGYLNVKNLTGGLIAVQKLK